MVCAREVDGWVMGSGGGFRQPVVSQQRFQATMLRHSQPLWVNAWGLGLRVRDYQHTVKRRTAQTEARCDRPDFSSISWKRLSPDGQVRTVDTKPAGSAGYTARTTFSCISCEVHDLKIQYDSVRYFQSIVNHCVGSLLDNSLPMKSRSAMVGPRRSSSLQHM